MAQAGIVAPEQAHLALQQQQQQQQDLHLQLQQLENAHQQQQEQAQQQRTGAGGQDAQQDSENTQDEDGGGGGGGAEWNSADGGGDPDYERPAKKPKGGGGGGMRGHNKQLINNDHNGCRNHTGYIGVRKRNWGMYAAEIRDGSKRRRVLPPALAASGPTASPRSAFTPATTALPLFLVRRRWLGSFSQAKEAGMAYDAALILQKKHRAKTNFIYSDFATIPRPGAEHAGRVRYSLIPKDIMEVRERDRESRRTGAGGGEPGWLLLRAPPQLLCSPWRACLLGRVQHCSLTPTTPHPPPLCARVCSCTRTTTRR